MQLVHSKPFGLPRLSDRPRVRITATLQLYNILYHGGCRGSTDTIVQRLLVIGPDVATTAIGMKMSAVSTRLRFPGIRKIGCARSAATVYDRRYGRGDDYTVSGPVRLLVLFYYALKPRRLHSAFLTRPVRSHLLVYSSRRRHRTRTRRCQNARINTT